MIAPCGTYAGSKTHDRRHEPVCPSCKQARRDYWRLKQAEHRQKGK